MSENTSGSIQITKEEATSAHVDDLLKRQMSMRGDPGVTRDHRRKWYFQNWLVLGLAGALGAIVAWAIIEPFFDDQIYLQGPVAELNLRDSLPDRIVDGDQALVLNDAIEGSLRIKGEKIYLYGGADEILPSGGSQRADWSSLHNGDNIGVYVDYRPGAKDDLAIMMHFVRSPPAQREGRAAMTLSQLHARSAAAALFTFALVAGCIGLFIGGVDGVICRLPRRAMLSAAVGLAVGLMGGFICSIIANIAYGPLHDLASAQMGKGGAFGAFGFLVQMVGRSLAWGLAGMAMGLGQGIALRSGRLLLYGAIGGIIGGLFGGMLFDPIDMILLGTDKPSAHWSRLVGFTVIGLGVGGMIGFVELVARDAWLRMTQGPLTGKEFLLFKDLMTIGSSPRSDLYLFNDPQVLPQHAIIRAVGDESEIEARDRDAVVLLNTRPVKTARLRHGDNVTIGRATFVFQRRKN
jgi:hypothetical protein